MFLEETPRGKALLEEKEKTEVEIGVMQIQAKECLEPPEATLSPHILLSAQKPKGSSC